jgi:activator of HSP90 ATPase
MKPIIISSIVNTSADFIYRFFTDSKLHTEITGGKAVINKKIGGKFTAWDGYIEGEIISLDKNRKIVQKWRTTDFNKKDQDSILEITLSEIEKNRSKLILKHSELPEGSEEEYKNGWKEFYIKPLKEFIKRQKPA